MAIYTPDQLTYEWDSVTQGLVSAFATAHATHTGDFSTDTSGLYSAVMVSGTSSIAVGSGTAIFSGASAGHALLKASELGLAPYMYALITVDAVSAAAQVTPRVGFHADSSNYVWAYMADGQVNIDSKIAGNQVTGTLSGSFSAPYTLVLALCYPEAHAWVDSGSGYLAPTESITLHSTDLRALSRFSTDWKPVFGFDRSAGASGTISAFRAGYLGCAPGIRDYKPVTHANGQPWQVGATQYFSATCATGAAWETNHMAIIGVDVDTRVATIASHLFFRLASGNLDSVSATRDVCTALYGGQIVRNPQGTGWIILTNGWGYQSPTTDGIDIFCATTTADILSGAHALDAYRVDVPSDTSLYDCTIRLDGSTWKMACAETAVRANWNSYHTAYFEGASLDTLSLIRTDETVQAEQQIWCKVGGTWYLTSGGTDGPHYWNADVSSHIGDLFDGLEIAGTNVGFSGFGSGYCLTGINRGGSTQYMVLLFSNAQEAGNASKGYLIVEQSNELASLNEWPGSVGWRAM
jgi:hypothetical protein